MKKISIIIPVYNEEKTLAQILDRIIKINLHNLKKEIIIVDDSSKDKSKDIIKSYKKRNKNILAIKHEKNKGKGAAVRSGIKLASGDIILIQDADTEYDPKDLVKLIEPILNGRYSVVYGSRMMGNITGFKVYSHYYGNKFLSLLTRILYSQKITDMETCYKVFKKEVIKSLDLKANKFDIEPEITAKILKKGYKILEIPINYKARSFSEGKKIKWHDGFAAIYTLFKYRF